jgi:hypothetical protein
MAQVKTLFMVVMFVAAAALFNCTVAAAEDDSIRLELDQAKQEIQQLRTELAELKESSNWKYRSELKSMVDNVPAASSDLPRGSLILPAGWSIQPYGYFKFDMSYDDSAVNGENGDYIVSVKPENSTTRDDDAFSFTARQTRLGMKVFAPDIGDLKVMGRFEIDFYNPVTTSTNENKSTPQMRHAYGQVTGEDWSLLFGQTSDIISPLFPDTLNYTVGWFGGNIGYRHPQLQVAKWWDCPDTDARLKIETALSRDLNNDLDGGGVDDGQDSSTPTVLARVSGSMPYNGKRVEAGVSGHFGHEEIDWDHTGDDDQVDTWSLNVDLLMPICDTLEFKSEVFVGENINTYFGGIGQGVNSTTRNEIESAGGWMQLAYKPCSEWNFHTGTGIDSPSAGDLEDDDKDSNCFVFSNVIYNFSKYLSTGVELTYWRTGYKNSDSGDDFRVQHSWKLSF